jgi:tetratricopeptide (TPR) repeat protein
MPEVPEIKDATPASPFSACGFRWNRRENESEKTNSSFWFGRTMRVARAGLILLVLVVFGCAGTEPRSDGSAPAQGSQGKASALERRALDAMQAGDFEAGIRIYQQLLETEPDNGRALYYIGYAHGRLGEIDSEIHYYEAAVVAGYRTVELFINLGEAYLGRGQPQEAVAAYRRALDLDSGSPDAHFGIGRALLEQHRYDEGVAYLERAVTLAPGVPEFREYLGLFYERAGRLEDARRQFARILENDPDYEGAREHLQQIIRRQDKLQEAQPAVGGD